MESPAVTEPRQPLSYIQYGVGPYVLIGLIAALRPTFPSLSWRLAAAVALISFMLRATKYDTGEGLQNYSMGSTFGSMSFSAIMLCLLSDPVKECRYEGQEQPTEDMPLWKKVYWMICIQANTRGVGWNYQVRQHPVPYESKIWD